MARSHAVKLSFVFYFLIIPLQLVHSAPLLNSLTPNFGSINQTVLLSGSGFTSIEGSVKFNGVSATILSWSDTSITARVPSGAATGNVVVSNFGASENSNTLPFTIITSSPAVISISQSSAPTGGSVVVSSITGSNLSPGATIQLNLTGQNSITATSFSMPRSTEIFNITFDLTNAATGQWDLQIKNPDGKSVTLTSTFTVTLPSTPTISSISPSFGSVNTDVVITGTDFTSATGTVAFNGVTATIVSWSNTSIRARVPSGATTGNVVILIVGRSSNGTSFTVLTGAPSITSLTPSEGEQTFIITTDISGNNLSPGAMVELRFTGQTSITAAGFTVANQNSITNARFDLSSTGVGDWDVVVSNPDGQSGTLAGGFRVKQATSRPNLKSIKTYPNPICPGSGGSQDAPGILFSRLTSQATIKIYTITGDLVKTIEKTSTNAFDDTSVFGMRWDLRNESGNNAASGVYIYVVTNSSGEKAKGRVVIIR